MVKSRTRTIALEIISVLSVLILSAPTDKIELLQFLVWLLISIWAVRKVASKLSKSDVLLSLVPSALLGVIFFKRWSSVSYVETFTESHNLNKNLILVLVAVFLGMVSIRVVSKIISSLGRVSNAARIDREFKESKLSKKEMAVILFTSIVAISLFSKSSPLYPFNDWVDVNIFLTVGKSLCHGNILYVDIYEQKGPLLFFIYVIPALISKDSFLGVYLLEIISAVFFLYFSYKIVRLFCGEKMICLMPLYAFAVYSTKAFTHGGSVEEMCLPLLTYSVLCIIRLVYDEKYILSFKESIFNGIIIGCIFWIKYTMLGMYIGCFLVLLVVYLSRKKYVDFVKLFGLVLIGMAVVTVPTLIYFVVNNAMSDLWSAYFYNNLFLYNTDKYPSVIVAELSGLWDAFRLNSFVVTSIVLGLLYSLKNNKKAFASIFICLITMVVLLYTRKYYVYYSFLLCAFMPLAYVLLGSILENGNITSKFLNKTKYFVMILVCCWLLYTSQNVSYLFGSKEDLPQYKLASIISSYEDQSLVNYKVLDVGLYTLTGTTPEVKYFCKFNVNLQEMKDEQKRYVDEGVTNFVVTRDYKMKSKNYFLLASETYNFEDKDRTFYLYKRVEK